MTHARLRLLPVFALLIAVATGASPDPPYDLLIRNAVVVDGTGGTPYRSDLAVTGDRIAAIGVLEAGQARRVIDAKGRFLTPGFIDIHAHLDDGERNKKKTLRSSDARYRAAQNYVLQGVTTAFVNPDGGQPASLSAQRRELEQLGIGVNVALANGHDTLRRQVMGKDTGRPANAGEIARMQELLVRGMTEEGSFGLSLGLEYNSGLYSDTNELRELARVLPAHNGVFIAHLRSQGSAPMWYKPSIHGERPPPTLEASLTEVFEVARETGAVVVATHIKGWGPGYRGDAARTVARINDARAHGARIFADIYPYDSAGSDGNFVALPPWSLKGAKAQSDDDDDEAPKPADFQAGLRRTLADAAKFPDLRRDVEHQVALKGGAENIRVLEYPDPAYVGKSLAELMQLRKLGLTELVVALQLEGYAHRAGGVKLRAFSMEEKDVALLLTQAWCMGSTDGWIVVPEDAVGPLKYIGTNRRCFGSYPRRLAHFVRDEKLETIEETVRKCTSLPAQILNLPDRGKLAVGHQADLVLIDLPNVRDNTTFLEPNEYPAGIDAVFVNGVAVVEEGRPTLALPGRVLQPVQVNR